MSLWQICGKSQHVNDVSNWSQIIRHTLFSVVLYPCHQTIITWRTRWSNRRQYPLTVSSFVMKRRTALTIGLDVGLDFYSRWFVWEAVFRMKIPRIQAFSSNTKAKIILKHPRNEAKNLFEKLCRIYDGEMVGLTILFPTSETIRSNKNFNITEWRILLWWLIVFVRSVSDKINLDLYLYLETLYLDLDLN